jgi:hypothetical protein
LCFFSSFLLFSRKRHFFDLEKKKKYRWTGRRRNNYPARRRGRRRREKEEADEEARGGYGAFKARAEQVVDGIGVASQGCFCHACASEIEWDGSGFLFKGE